MKQMIHWQTSVVVMTSIGLALTAFPASSTAASTARLIGIQSSAPRQTSFQNQAEYKLAQASDNCRRVDTRSSNLNVRSSPGGTIIGSLTDKSLVSIENTGSNGWVPISSPRQGYVFGAYLNLSSYRREDPRHNASLMGDERRLKEGVRCPLFGHKFKLATLLPFLIQMVE